MVAHTLMYVHSYGLDCSLERSIDKKNWLNINTSEYRLDKFNCDNDHWLWTDRQTDKPTTILCACAEGSTVLSLEVVQEVVNPQSMRESYSSQFVRLSVCLSVTSTLEPAAIGMLQLRSQQCLHGTLQCCV